MFDLLFIMATV